MSLEEPNGSSHKHKNKGIKKNDQVILQTASQKLKKMLLSLEEPDGSSHKHKNKGIKKNDLSFFSQI